MPSPSGFGRSAHESGPQGRAKIKEVLSEVPAHRQRKKIEGNTAKPYADFTRPELVHMNVPDWPNYLKVYKPQRIKIIDHKAIARMPKAEVHRVRRLGKSTPWDEEAFRRTVKGCAMRTK